ncbi:MAG TPA: hypothetical protein VFM87_02760 [Agrococcus sp.]|nr:hypothetical protein [Agrococcus sp.]
MRWTIPMAIVGVVALAGCASAGDPAESSAPADAPSASTAPETPSATPTDDDDDATASPSPTAAEPQRITDEAILGSYSLDDLPGGEPLVVWASADHSLVHVIGSGSGTESCQPTGESIEVDDGELEIEFEEPDPMGACPADLRVFGWAFEVAGDASITTAHVDGWVADEDFTVEIQSATSPS